MRTALLSSPVIIAVTLLSACHGIEHPPTSPTPPPRSQAAALIHIVPTPGELPIGGGSASISVEALGADGGGVSTPISLFVSEGELGASSVTTDRTGHAIASWQGTKTTNITARSGEAISIVTLTVRTPIELPPPVPPVQPPPQPEPTPLPTPRPPLTVILAASPMSIPVGGNTTLSASVSNLEPGEVVTAYQWDYEGDKTIDETSVSASRSQVYTSDGIIAPTVRVLTSANRSAIGAGQVIVFKPLR